jgi:trans-aconitate 2-methyltransferase
MNNKDKWNAQYYKKNSEGQHAEGLKIVKELSLTGNENVLDVGCGDGRTTVEIAKRVPEGSVLGVDISPNMIDEARKSFGDVKNLSFECIDISQFTSNKVFDFAVSFSAFHWVKDQKKALKNIYSVLKPGGKLLMKFSLQQKRNPLSIVFEDPKWEACLRRQKETYFPHTVESFSELLENVGFKNLNVQTKELFRAFTDKEALFNWSLAWVPAATGLSGNKAKEFTQDVVDSICAENKDGKPDITFSYLLARAEK